LLSLLDLPFSELVRDRLIHVADQNRSPHLLNSPITNWG
jgi:hypothetical protein